MNEVWRHIITLNHESDIHKFGVYKLFHINNPENFYIGSAANRAKEGAWKKGFYHRLQSHLKGLREKKHHSNFLQNIINKHGIDGLRMQIIEITERKNAVTREQFYIDTLKPRLNSNPHATSWLGMKHSEASRIKMSESVRKRGPVSEETIEKIKKALKGRVLRGSFVTSEEVKKKISAALKGRKLSQERIIQLSKPINQYNSIGQVVESYQSASEAGRTTGIDKASINKCANGRRDSAGGFIWKWAFEKGLTISRLKK